MSDDRTRDEVFMAAQEAINNQSNAQGRHAVFQSLLYFFTNIITKSFV